LAADDKHIPVRRGVDTARITEGEDETDQLPVWVGQIVGGELGTTTAEL